MVVITAALGRVNSRSSWSSRKALFCNHGQTCQQRSQSVMLCTMSSHTLLLGSKDFISQMQVAESNLFLCLGAGWNPQEVLMPCCVFRVSSRKAKNHPLPLNNKKNVKESSSLGAMPRRMPWGPGSAFPGPLEWPSLPGMLLASGLAVQLSQLLVKLLKGGRKLSLQSHQISLSSPD